MPVTEDTEEAPHVYSLLCELAASGHAALASPDAPKHVIATLAEAFLRDAVPSDNPVYAQMVALVRQIQVSISNNIIKSFVRFLQQSVSKFTCYCRAMQSCSTPC